MAVKSWLPMQIVSLIDRPPSWFRSSAETRRGASVHGSIAVHVACSSAAGPRASAYLTKSPNEQSGRISSTISSPRSA
eukprot:504811-Hanusia_phi.AAC.3